jgi:hypothetical protein
MATSNSTDSCISCKFFITGGQLGSCHRYPQSLTKAPSEWCGEYFFDSVARIQDELVPLPIIPNKKTIKAIQEARKIK